MNPGRKDLQTLQIQDIILNTELVHRTPLVNVDILVDILVDIMDMIMHGHIVINTNLGRVGLFLTHDPRLWFLRKGTKSQKFKT
jgi:hypothetical protein